MPIFDGHQRQLQYQRIDLSEQSRRGYRQFLTVQRQQQYEQLEGLIRAADALLGRIREQVRVADALVGAARQQLATGDVAILDYLNLVTSYRTLQFSLTQAADRPAAEPVCPGLPGRAIVAWTLRVRERAQSSISACCAYWQWS